MSYLFGISVYLQDMTEDYLKTASENGAKYVFTSLHIPEEDLSQAAVKIRELLGYCKKFGMHLVPDVSPITFEKLGIDSGDFTALKELGVKALRLDYGFDDLNTVKELQQDFEIMLNASVVSEDYINKCQAHGIAIEEIIGVHNFYPKTDTGLSLDSVIQTNRVFAKYNIPVITFVPGDKLKRFPLYEGLPTAEKHRSMHPYTAAVELIQTADTTGIMIGDSMVYDETMEWIHDYLHNNTLTLPVFLQPEYAYLFDEDLRSRKDISEQVVRLMTPRKKGIFPENNGIRHKGDIIIQNDLAGRYAGELQLCKQDLPFSPQGNKIGFLHPDLLELMPYVTGNVNIKLVPMKGA